MTNNSLFITATDTGVGKTLVSGLLFNYLSDHSIKVGYQKWISTGDAENPADLAETYSIAGCSLDGNDLDLLVPYRFSFPASPHLAGEIDGVDVDPEKILSVYSKICKYHEAIIVEGVGGLMVPLRRDLLLADLLSRLKIPTVIVSRSGLGTLNHTLLTLEALRTREIPVAGVIFTDSNDENETITTDNLRTISEMGQVDVLGRLPFRRDHKDLIAPFRKIGDRLLPYFRK